MASSKRKHLKPGEKVALRLTRAQVDLIVDKTFIGGKLLAILYAARVWDDGVVVRCTLGHLVRLARHVESEASDATDMELQKKLAAIAVEIRTLEQRYYVLASVGTAT